MTYNVQPLKVFYDGGNLCLSHNGNLTNAASLRQELAKEGHVFQTTVDSEVVLSLIARSRKKDLGRARSGGCQCNQGCFCHPHHE